MAGPDRVPWAAWTPLGAGGGSITGTARKITLHTMECATPCWPTYSGGSTAPHLSLDPATGQARQHIDLSRSAYALASPGAPNSPNMNAGTNIQVELVGYASKTPGYPDSWYAQLAEWIGWLCDAWGVPKTFPFPFTGSDGYGSGGAVRQSWPTFQSASGIVGHSHAPYNDHWDPGAIDTALLARHLTAPQPTDWLIEGVIPMAAYTIAFFQKDGIIYEADLIAGTYRRVQNMDDLDDRKHVLTSCGIPWKDWKIGTDVQNPEAFGVRVD